MVRSRRLHAAVLAVLVLSAGCSRIERVVSFGASGVGGPPLLLDPKAAAEAPCTGRLAADPQGLVPEPLPALEGSTPLKRGTQDGRLVYTAFIRGGPGSVAALQNLMVDKLRSIDLSVAALPFEEGAARAIFDGRLAGSLLVQPLCEGYVAYRLSVTTDTIGPIDLGDPETAARRSCAGLLVPDSRGRPLDLPIPPGSTPMRVVRGADLDSYTVFLRGSASLIPDVAGALAESLKQGGYVVGVSKASGSRSVAFSGKRQGLVRVQPFCAGHLAIQYVIDVASARVPGLPAPGVAARQSCSGRLTRGDAEAGFTAEFPRPAGSTALRAGILGEKQLLTVFITGGPSDVKPFGSGYASALRGSGFTVAVTVSSDEVVRGRFEGTRNGDFVVQSLCDGHLALRLVLEPQFPDMPEEAASVPCSDRLYRQPGAALPNVIPSVSGSTTIRERRDSSASVFDVVIRGGLADVGPVRAGLYESFRRTRTFVIGYPPLESGQGVVAFRRKDTQATSIVTVRPLCAGYLLLRYRLTR